MRLSREMLRSELIKKVELISGEDISTCYQCGKCSAGCPLESEMGILPSGSCNWVTKSSSGL